MTRQLAFFPVTADEDGDQMDLIEECAAIEVPDFAEIGRRAFAAGAMRVPVLDADVRAAISGQPIGGTGAEIMRAWLSGWDAANLADDVLVTAPAETPIPCSAR